MRRALLGCSASLFRTSGSTIRHNILSTTLRQPTLNPQSRAALYKTLSCRNFSSTPRIYESDARPADDDDANKVTKFHELQTRNLVHPNVVKNLTTRMGLESMTEVQTATINAALQGTDM